MRRTVFFTNYLYLNKVEYILNRQLVRKTTIKKFALSIISLILIILMSSIDNNFRFSRLFCRMNELKKNAASYIKKHNL
jgi:hypothetical protein